MLLIIMKTVAVSLKIGKTKHSRNIFWRLPWIMHLRVKITIRERGTERDLMLYLVLSERRVFLLVTWGNPLTYISTLSGFCKPLGIERNKGQPDRRITWREGRFSNQSGKASSLRQLSIVSLRIEERCWKPCGGLLAHHTHISPTFSAYEDPAGPHSLKYQSSLKQIDTCSRLFATPLMLPLEVNNIWLLIHKISFLTDGRSMCNALNFGHWMIATSARWGNISTVGVCS